MNDHSADSPWTVFEWATIRIVPSVHREQFLNVGVIVHARRIEFLEARIEVPWERLEALAPGIDRGVVERHLAAYLSICGGDEEAGPVALLPPSERFHWLTAPRSAIIQTSDRRPGRERDIGQALERLFREQCA
jgi:hypothetical protein